jgi:hypothetical protein
MCLGDLIQNLIEYLYFRVVREERERWVDEIHLSIKIKVVQNLIDY